MKGILPLCFLFMGACSPFFSRSGKIPPIPFLRSMPQEPSEARHPNFILLVSEAVPSPDQDGGSFTAAFVDGARVGKTGTGRKSEEHSLKLKLPIGNQPVRLEHWILTSSGEWTRLADELQPRERFVRIEDGTIARLWLRFSECASSHQLTLGREPAPR